MKIKPHRIAALFTVICLLTSVLCFSGCATANSSDPMITQVIQKALDEILPPDFEGDFEGNHDGFYFGTSVHLKVDLKGLKKVDGRWTWRAGGYNRSGFFSTGGVKLTPKSQVNQ